MDLALGFVGVLAWIVAVIALAAVVTWAVVRISPGDKPDKPDEGGAEAA